MDKSKWYLVVELVQTAFRDGVLAEGAAWHAVVLIPKGGSDYQIIGLVEVVRKASTVFLNCRFTASITHHDSLHGFRAGSGTGTTTLKVKLIHQVTAMIEEVLHVIFLELHKSYDALERSRCLEILEGYGVGPRALRLLCRYWGRLQMVVWAGR